MRPNTSPARALLAAALVCGLLTGLGEVATAGVGPGAGPVAGPSQGLAAHAGEDIGKWRVVASPDGAYLVSWTSPTPLPVTNARPDVLLDHRLVAPATVSGHTVSAIVRTGSAPDPSRLDVRLSDRLLDRRATPPADRPAAPFTRPTGAVALGRDPGRPGSHQVVTETYRLPWTKITGMPAKIEMLGHVVRPADPDAGDPLVLFLHGRHSFCYRPKAGALPVTAQTSTLQRTSGWPCRGGTVPIPSYLGYAYVQRLLASQGYVTVSISANGINAQDGFLPDGGAAARASLVRRHLDQWAQWVTAGRYAADLKKVVLVGHSRGGEGVARASIVTPLTSPYRFVGQVLIAPTDFGRQATAYIPTVTMLPYCDGDVSDLQGQIFTDVSRDLTTDDTALHSSVLVLGANHNFFNTEWTPGISAAPSWDDWGGAPNGTCGKSTAQRLTAFEQRRVAKTYIAGAVQLTASGHVDLLPMFDGTRVHIPSAGDADVRSATVGAGRVLRRPGIGAILGPSEGVSTQLCVGKRSDQGHPTWCGRDTYYGRTPHWVDPYPPGLDSQRDLEVGWTTPGGHGGLTFTHPLNLSTATSLDLRTAVDPTLGDVQIKVRLHDSTRSVLVTPVGGGIVPTLPRGPYSLSKRWAQTVRVPLAGVTGINLSRVTGFDLVPVSPDGRVWVLDAAAVRPGLPAVPVQRLARVSLGDVQVAEGDAPGTQVVVPFTIDGPVRQDTEIVVLRSLWPYGELLPPVHVPVAAGQRSGSVSFQVEGDTVDDLDVTRFALFAFATRRLMTEDYIGMARILDDDPPPTVSVTPVARHVTEGHSAQWRVTLSTPTDYPVQVVARPVWGQVLGERLKISDLPLSWARDHIYPMRPPGTPLNRTNLRLYGYINPGRLTSTLSLPVRVDGADESTEPVSMRVHLTFGLINPAVRTIFVHDPG